MIDLYNKNCLTLVGFFSDLSNFFKNMRFLRFSSLRSVVRGLLEESTSAHTILRNSRVEAITVQHLHK